MRSRKSSTERVASNTAKELIGSDSSTTNLIFTKQNTTWAKKYGGSAIPSLHYQLLSHFCESKPELESNYSFLVLKIQLLAQREDTTSKDLEHIFYNQILTLPNLSNNQIQQAFNVMLSVYKMKEVNTQKMMECISVLKNSFQMAPNLRNTTVILSSLYSFRLIEDCVSVYKDLVERSKKDRTGDLKIDCRVGAIMVRVFAYAQGPHGAHQYMNKFNTISSEPPNLFMWTSLIRVKVCRRFAHLLTWNS